MPQLIKPLSQNVSGNDNVLQILTIPAIIRLNIQCYFVPRLALRRHIWATLTTVSLSTLLVYFLK